MLFYKNVTIFNICTSNYDKIDLSEGIDVNKINESNEFDICHYWYFLDNGFLFKK